MADSVMELNAIQLAKQVAFGTALTTATHLWGGRGTIKVEDKIIHPNYVTGEPGGLTVEDGFVADTGTMFNLADLPASPALMVYLLNQAIVASVGPETSFPFTTPVNQTPNTLTPFSWKLSTMAQTYDVADVICEEFNFHGNVDENNGVVSVNAKMGGRKAAAGGTLTASLALIPNHTAGILNQNNCGIKIAAVGSVPSGGSAQTGTLKAISLTWKTGFVRGRYSDSRAALDYAQVDGGGLAYVITGTLKCLFGANAVTHFANARASTPKNIQLLYTAGNADTLTYALPITFTDVPELGSAETQGMVMVEFPFVIGPSRTATAVYPSITAVIPSHTVT